MRFGRPNGRGVARIPQVHLRARAPTRRAFSSPKFVSTAAYARHSMPTAMAGTASSPEATLLGDFLLAPAALRDFVTLRQFTDVFPRAHRSNPGVPQLYRELQRLRDRDVDSVRRDVAHEVKRSRPLRRAYAQERRRLHEGSIAGLDPMALQLEAEVSPRSMRATADIQAGSTADVTASFLAIPARSRIRCRAHLPASRQQALVSSSKSRR